jgi:NAD(P)-dependent dehydrogenase (short-subunit alcohol dehydrogenase family)
MKGKTVLITGANQGVGKATAVALARDGAQVSIVSRSSERGRAAVADIESASGSKGVELIVADLSSVAQVRRVAAEFKSRHVRLDVLVNNAGVFVPKRHVTVDGLEETFAVNHLAYFVLTNDLVDLLASSAPARVVNVASDAHGAGKMHWDDLQFATHRYGGWSAYAQSKLANLLFTFELARRLDGTRVTANAVHPGVVASGFGRTYGGLMAVLYRLGGPFMLTPEQGARTSIHVASSPDVEGVTGKYFARSRLARPSAAARDETSQRKLWALSEEIVADLRSH